MFILPNLIHSSSNFLGNNNFLRNFGEWMCVYYIIFDVVFYYRIGRDRDFDYFYSFSSALEDLVIYLIMQRNSVIFNNIFRRVSVEWVSSIVKYSYKQHSSHIIISPQYIGINNNNITKVNQFPICTLPSNLSSSIQWWWWSRLVLVVRVPVRQPLDYSPLY